MKRFCILLGTMATGLSTSHAVHTLGYEFNEIGLGALANGASIANSGSVGGAGTFNLGTSGGTGTIVNTGVVAGTAYGSVNLGRTLTLTPNADGNQNLEAPHINANAAVSAFGFAPNLTYSAFAWINMASNAGDNMIFGGNGAVAGSGGAVLHLGTRGGNVQSGHWGDDAGPDQGLNIPVANGQWHVIAFTNDGATGLQTIYLNPGSPGQVTMNGGLGTGGAMDQAINLLIGTANNGGSFNGQIDRITAYDSLRTPAQFAAAATIPEPASVAILASGIGFILLRRRRRA